MNDNQLLKQRLEAISDSYYDFVRGILEDCKDYKHLNIEKQLIDYIDAHPEADTSEILEFEMDAIGIPYGDDDGKWYRWGKEITEEEAQRIVDEEYSE